jgi:hypothetical protein
LMIVRDFILDDDRRGPLSAALFNAYIGAFTFAEMAELLRGAGFRDVKVVHAPEYQGNGIMTAERP